MNRKQQMDPARTQSIWKRSVSALTGLFLLSGCANFDLAEWIPDLTGGEGKIAQRISSRSIDAPPAPDQTPVIDPAPDTTQNLPPAPTGPSREEVTAIQENLAELGYNPGQVDGIAGTLTKEAIKTFQNDANMEADGRITRELADSLAAAPRPEKPLIPDVAVVPESPPETELTPEVEPEIALTPEPEIELAIREPEIVPPVKVVHVKNAKIPPIYDAGDAYVWSNGRVETVVRVAGNKLFWRVDNGVSYTADRNFLIPPSNWTGPAGTGESNARLDEGKFWPLATDSAFTFEVEDNGQLQTWQCRTAGTERISVPAGRFAVVALTCDRDSAPPGEWVRRIWHYAPAVRHYVARIDIMPDGSRISKELVGVRPGAEGWPPAVRAGLDQAIQDALGGLPDGESSLWSSTMVKEEFVILPGTTHDTVDGVRCRTFELTARGAGISRIYPAKACLSDKDQKWLIPNSNSDRSDANPFETSAS
ncbi:MAG: peptidoglycan-binding protein [Proteobacteria bacterium]|nr:peptidoglycan-binding protein [Pseudomonadota bacterium]